MLSVIELPVTERRAARAHYTPLAVAFSDVNFREEELAGDRLGDAMIFFDLTDRQAHRLFCNCHYAYPAEAPAIARRVRAMANRQTLRERWQRMLFTLTGS